MNAHKRQRASQTEHAQTRHTPHKQRESAQKSALKSYTTTHDVTFSGANPHKPPPQCNTNATQMQHPPPFRFSPNLT